MTLPGMVAPHCVTVQLRDSITPPLQSGSMGHGASLIFAPSVLMLSLFILFMCDETLIYMYLMYLDQTTNQAKL